MYSVFISYSWNDIEITKDIIIPILKELNYKYFIDYENVQLNHSDENLISNYLIKIGLDRLSTQTHIKPWNFKGYDGKPNSWLPNNLEKEISKRDILLVVMSNSAAMSYWVNREIDYSISLCKKILIVRIDNSRMPEYLLTLVNCDIIPCIKFTKLKEFNDEYEGDCIYDFYSKKREVRHRVSSFNLFKRHDIRYYSCGDNDKLNLISAIKDLSSKENFDYNKIDISENIIKCGKMNYEFISLKNAPYFPNLNILKCPVTNEQYSQYSKKVFIEGKKFTPNKNDLLLPVVYISWNEAIKFCEWLSENIGKRVRLPKEIEWEFACSAGNSGMYFFGNESSKLIDYAWYDHFKPEIVGLKKPNKFGLFDMHGNISEWCIDRFDQGEIFSILTPHTSGSFRVVKGGAGFIEAHTCSTWYRYFDLPNSREFRRGFRLVAEI